MAPFIFPIVITILALICALGDKKRMEQDEQKPPVADSRPLDDIVRK